MHTKQIAALTAILFLSGCQSFQRIPIDPSTIAVPLVDMGHVKDVERFKVDVRECQEYASKIDPAKGAGDAAVAGLLLGLAGGSLLGDRSAGKWLGGLGGLGAGASVYNDWKNKQQSVMGKCLSGRGYVVLS